jgi:hypothetical protein
MSSFLDDSTNYLMDTGSIILGGLITSIGGLITNLTSNIQDTPTSIYTGISSDIQKKLLLGKDEISLFYYNSYNIYIILTNKRFIKLEDDKICSESYLENISAVNHIKNSFLYFDKIEIIEKNNRIETYGIYESIVCEYFIKLLNNIINIINKSDIELGNEDNLSDYNFEVKININNFSDSESDSRLKNVKIDILNDKCIRCYDKYIVSNKIITCKHKNICNQCTNILDMCPICNVSYC